MPILLRSVYSQFRYIETPREFSPGALLYENAHRLSHRRLFMHKLHRSHLRWLVIFHPVVTAASKCSSSALSCGSETIYCCGDYILSFHKCQIQFTSSALISIWHNFSFILIAVSRRKFSNWQFHHH